jgi:hypothetical protein
MGIEPPSSVAVADVKPQHPEGSKSHSGNPCGFWELEKRDSVFFEDESLLENV